MKSDLHRPFKNCCLTESDVGLSITTGFETDGDFIKKLQLTAPRQSL
jgi:hypothetical protein